MLPLQARTDQRVIAMKRYMASFSKAPALLEPYYQIVWCHIQDTHCGGGIFLSLYRDAVDVFYSPNQLGCLRDHRIGWLKHIDTIKYTPEEICLKQIWNWYKIYFYGNVAMIFDQRQRYSIQNELCLNLVESYGSCLSQSHLYCISVLSGERLKLFVHDLLSNIIIKKSLWL